MKHLNHNSLKKQKHFNAGLIVIAITLALSLCSLTQSAKNEFDLPYTVRFPFHMSNVDYKEKFKTSGLFPDEVFRIDFIKFIAYNDSVHRIVEPIFLCDKISKLTIPVVPSSLTKNASILFRLPRHSRTLRCQLGVANDQILRKREPTKPFDFTGYIIVDGVTKLTKTFRGTFCDKPLDFLVHIPRGSKLLKFEVKSNINSFNSAIWIDPTLYDH